MQLNSDCCNSKRSMAELVETLLLVCANRDMCFPLGQHMEDKFEDSDPVRLVEPYKMVGYQSIGYAMYVTAWPLNSG